MSELQTEADDGGITIDNDHIESGETENQEAGTVESGAELATATEEKQDKSNDGVQKAINKQHAKYKEEERKRIASENEATELRGKLEAIEAERGKITIPDAPDPYDEDFEVKREARESAIRQQAARDAQQNVVTEQQVANKEAAEKVEQERIGELVNSYDKRIATLGLDSGEIKKAGETVVSYGISGELAEYILGDADGPLLIKHLADNPIVLDELSNMSPIQAAFKVNSDIRAAASTLKPQASETPDPAETLNGKGRTEAKSPLIAGATFT